MAMKFKQVVVWLGSHDVTGQLGRCGVIERTDGDPLSAALV